MNLKSYVCGTWQSGRDNGVAMRDATTGEFIAQASSAGVDFAAVLAHARNVGGPQLRAMTFHERAALLKALGMRAEIESAFNIDACDIYGLSEVMGPGVAQEFAGTKEGPTIWEDHFIAEIVDPSGRAIADGEQGELVFTSLTKQAMPVIRYRTRDLTRLLPGSVTAMRRMAKISGRSDDMLIVRGVNVFPTQIEELILGCKGFAPHYEIEVTRPNRLDEITITVEARPELSDNAHRTEALLLAATLKDNIGISADIRVAASGSLPRSAGKASRVKDRR